MRVYRFRHIRGLADCSDGRPSHYHLPIVRATFGALLLAALLAHAAWAGSARTEVVVELSAPPLAGARGLAAVGPALVVEAAQRRLEARILAAVPGAEVTWRYRRVLDGLAVEVPAGSEAALARLPGVAAVYPSVRYHALLSSTPGQIGTPELWGPGLSGSAGRGLKIGIIDDGVDASHPFFDPAGFVAPPGFPRGDRRYTSPKVIVARAFPPPGSTWKNGDKPFDPVYSSHGTHVAGIAAGDAGTVAPADAGRPALELSGVAPLAYIGNYKALAVPDLGGLNGNSPEIVAAIEAAVEDGMDVINLSLGEAEVPPERDAVAKALEGAAAAGVVPVVSAGNEFEEYGAGSVASPASAPAAITVAAATPNRLFGVLARVTGPPPVPSGLVAFGGLPSADPFPKGPQPLVDVRALGADARLCGSSEPPLAEGALAGKVALVRRGGCGVETKVRNADRAGAKAIVVADDGTAAFGGVESPFALPALFVTEEVGDALLAFASSRADGTILVSVAAGRAEVQVPGGALASFSASGPTPLGLAAKPDVTAPGVDVVSSFPGKQQFGFLSGTSMAAPHVAGAAALLRERHPSWTVAQVKSALVTTGRPVWLDPARRREAPSARQGGGLVDLPAADDPLLFAAPQNLGFGLLDISGGAATAGRELDLADAGGGSGTWSVAVVEQAPGGGAHLTAPSSVDVPGSLTITGAAGARATEGERTGFVVLTREGESRRIPFWFRVVRPRLGGEPARRLFRPGLYAADTRAGRALVDRYLYPERNPASSRQRLSGPELVFRLTIRRPVANFGAAVLDADPGVDVEPRIVRGVSEDRLAGITSLPFVVNPYLARFSERALSAAALFPEPGEYAIVFDSGSARRAGRFRFVLWIDDVTPPRIRIVSRRGLTLQARVSDRGSGVDPEGVTFSLDGRDPVRAVYDPATGTATIDLEKARPGRHRLVIRASDRQEAKNTETVPGILPNTAVLAAWITVP